MAIITEEFPAENISGMWATVITGLVVVFIILALLIGVLYLLGLFGKLMGNSAKKKNAKNAEKAVDLTPAHKAAPVVIPAEDIAGDEDDEELIAVISAAIAAYAAADGTQYVIKKIKRTDRTTRSDWGNVGVRENTRPF